jgi:hypothetical protein
MTMTIATTGGAMVQASPDNNALVRTIIGSERYLEFDRRQSYFDCTQHDRKAYDFDGRVITPGGVRGMSTISAEKMPGIVPLRARRPSAPYRLGRIIIDAFTDLLFGENRFPEINVDGDNDSQDFTRTIARMMNLATKMVQARNLGGAIGTSCLSWAIINGIPRTRVHNAKNCRVVEWEDRDALIPRIVEEVQLYYRDEADPQKQNRIVRNWYWWRRTWTPNEDIVWLEVPVKAGQMPDWIRDEKRTNVHNDGLNHFVWIQNLPSELEDGVPDVDGLWEQLDEVDILYSVMMRGAKLNLDPTLVLKMDQDRVRMMGVKKGSDNALVVGKEGDANYLELAGNSITAGLALFESFRRTVLETAQCVVPDPNVIAAQGVSSVSIKALYSPMLGKAAVLRDQYAQGMKRLLEAISAVARARMSQAIVVIDETGEAKPGKFVLNLPPKVVKEPVLDELTGEPTGEEDVTLEPRRPGEGGEVDFAWPNWFPPTPDDQAKIATTLQTATAGKAYLSKQTATEIAAQAFGRSGSEEWERVQTQGAVEKQQQAAMMQEAAGMVEDPNELPPGAEPKGPPKPFGGGGGKPFGGGGKPPFPPKG